MFEIEGESYIELEAPVIDHLRRFGNLVHVFHRAAKHAVVENIDKCHYGNCTRRVAFALRKRGAHHHRLVPADSALLLWYSCPPAYGIDSAAGRQNADNMYSSMITQAVADSCVQFNP